MAFIRVIEDGQADGRARELFDADLSKDGYVWNLTRLLALRPQVLDAWRGLVGAIRTTLEQRRYELVTFAAARALRASYCMLAHGAILRDKFFSAEQVAVMARDPAAARILRDAF
jgi:AhpD family alkylhydroperoxidase